MSQNQGNQSSGGQRSQSGNFVSFSEARRLMRENGITQQNYQQRAQQYNLPPDPEQYYKDQGWTSQQDFFSGSGGTGGTTQQGSQSQR